MLKILHHRSKCIGCGTCALICDKFFKVVDDGLVDLAGAKYDKDKKEGKLEIKDIGCSKEAADSCPVQAIEVK